MVDVTSLGPSLTDVLHPGHFFLAPTLQLEWSHVSEAAEPWEIFQGRLLEPRFTRQQSIFESWNIFVVAQGEISGEPLLSLKVDRAAGLLHVVRGLHCYVWTNYTEGDNVLLSRETARWLRELVGTLKLADFTESEPLRHEVADLVFHAVIGTSRLPLSSVESPHPLFSLGQLAYLPQPADAEPLRSPQALVERGVAACNSRVTRIKLLEILLRATPAEQLAQVTAQFAERWFALQGANDLPAWLEAMFYEVSLSPWTDFVDKTLAFVRFLVAGGYCTVSQQVDFLCHLLVTLADHLTAYDLITFHHRGANYPDALLLDALLKEYLGLVEAYPELFQRDEPESESLGLVLRLRRQSLRRGWLLRRFYEDHSVPDAPTSPGEHTRVLPPPHIRVPEEQILQTAKRRRRLFAGDPLTRGSIALGVLRRSLADLEQPAELANLGAAVFIDRPLGVFKAPAEPDLTPLLAYCAISPSIAARRLEQLISDPVLAMEPVLAERLRQQVAVGLNLSACQLAWCRRILLARRFAGGCPQGCR